MNARVERLTDALKRQGIEAALLSSPHNVCYASGHDVPVEAGPSPFAAGPSLALVGADGSVTLIVPNTEEAAARANASADHVVAYVGYTYDEPTDIALNYVSAVRDALGEQATTVGVLGIEPATLPTSLYRLLEREFVELERRDAGSALAEARLIKTDDELAKLRRAIELTSIGQHATRAGLTPGITELELFAVLRRAMEEAADRRMPVTGDLIAGTERTAKVMGWPTSYVIQPGDLVIADLAPRYDGYWGDSCNTLCAGQPSAEQRRMLQATTEALARGIERMRPGYRACDVDAVCRETVGRHGYAYAHHTGHGLGTTVHDEPRLVPFDQTPLQPNMVLAIETGAYVPGIGGVRTEYVVLTTQSEPELLSNFPHAF